MDEASPARADEWSARGTAAPDRELASTATPATDSPRLRPTTDVADDPGAAPGVTLRPPGRQRGTVARLRRIGRRLLGRDRAADVSDDPNIYPLY